MARVDESFRKAGEGTAQALRASGTGASASGTSKITRDTTLNVAAQRLARDLAAIPGIERFGSIRLNELDRSGPRPLRTLWRIARGELSEQYGQLTIGEIVDRYGSGGARPSA
jgi:hypothetical protein